jgi:hypothetical protein
MRAVDHRATLGPAYLPSLRAKKSFSTAYVNELRVLGSFVWMTLD